MKKCPYCGKEYPAEAVNCALDGELLEEAKLAGIWPVPEEPTLSRYQVPAIPINAPTECVGEVLSAQKRPPLQAPSAPEIGVNRSYCFKGGFELRAADTCRRSGYKTVCSSLAGIKSATLTVGMDAITFEPRLIGAGGLLVALLCFPALALLVTYICFVAGVLDSSPGQALVIELTMVFYFAFIPTVLLVFRIARRTKRLQRHFPISSITEVQIFVHNIMLTIGTPSQTTNAAIKSPLLAEPTSSTAHWEERLLFTPEMPGELLRLAKALSATGLRVNEVAPKVVWLWQFRLSTFLAGLIFILLGLAIELENLWLPTYHAIMHDQDIISINLKLLIVSPSILSFGIPMLFRIRSERNAMKVAVFAFVFGTIINAVTIIWLACLGYSFKL